MKNLFLKVHKYKLPLLAMGCSTLVMLGVYLANVVYPIGINSVLCVDLYHQYAPLFAELWDKLMSGGSFFFSWQSGCGAPWLGNFFNYLSSPFSFLIILFPRENITEAIALIIFLKCILSAFTFALFINKHTRNKSLLISAFGVLYSCCGWFVAYYWDIMWLDAFYLLPLVALGIEKLIDNKKSAFYIITLALTFLTNYYMAYMVCIFSVCYFIYYFFCSNDNVFKFDSKITLKIIKNNRFINRGFNFALSSVGAVLVSAISIFPTVLMLRSSSATGNSFPEELKTYFNIFDFLVQHLTALEPTIRSSSEELFLPNISCGVLTALLIPLFFLTKTITKKEKILSAGLVGFLAAGFYINYLDFIWHGFHFPNDLPYRFSFMYSFVLLLVAFRTISHIKEIPVKYIKLTAASFVVFLLITQKLGSVNFDETAFWVNLAFVIVYLCILLLLNNEKQPQKTVAILLLILVCTEYTIGNSTKYGIVVPRDDYIYDYSEFKEIKEQIDLNEDGFYRLELLKNRPSMSPCFYGYNGVSYFTSMANEQMAKTQKKLGMQSNGVNSAIYNSQTPIYNAFFGIKYVFNSSIGSIQSLPMNYFTYKTQTVSFIAYENNYTLPLAFATNKNITECSFGNSNPFINQEQFFESATGIKNVFVDMDIIDIETDNLEIDEKELKKTNYVKYSVKYQGDATAEITLKSNSDGDAYIYIFSEGKTIETVDYKSNGQIYKQEIGSEPYIYYIGNLKRGGTTKATINIPYDEDKGLVNDTMYIYGAVIDKEQFEEGYNILQSSPLTITSFDDTQLSGVIKMPGDSVLYTSIPYDKGWHITVDGEPADNKIVEIGEMMMGVNLEAGEHTVEFTYCTPGFREGFIVSVSTVALLFVLFIIKRIREK